MEIIFTQNWNSKLGCAYFTTVRPYNPMKYCVGNEYSVRLGNVHMCDATLVKAKKLRMTEIDDYIAYLDTGQPKEYLWNFLDRLYKGKVSEFHYLLFNRIEKRMI